MNVWIIAALVFLLNLPFGYWRAKSDKFSRQWFLAVHLPVPFVVAIRLLSGLGYSLATFPIMIGAFFFGQLLGGKLQALLKKHTKIPVSACLVRDVMTGIGALQKSGIR